MLDLILTMRDIYINSNQNPLTKFISSSRSTEFKDILPWNISQMIMKTIPISKRIVKSYSEGYVNYFNDKIYTPKHYSSKTAKHVYMK